MDILEIYILLCYCIPFVFLATTTTGVVETTIAGAGTTGQPGVTTAAEEQATTPGTTSPGITTPATTSAVGTTAACKHPFSE